LLAHRGIAPSLRPKRPEPSPKPVNLLINAPFMTVKEAAALGVRRIGVGDTRARAAWGGFLQAAKEIAEAGTFSRLDRLPNVDARFRDS